MSSNKDTFIESSAPGKLILVGEYAVLEGAPALVAAVDRHSRVRITPSGDKWFSLDAPTIGINGVAFHLSPAGDVLYRDNLPAETLKRLHFFKTTFEYAARYLGQNGCPPVPARLVIDTGAFFDPRIKAKLGFGSSAALTVSVIKALFLYCGLPLIDANDPGRLFRLALAAHRRAQNGVGSGIDVAASSFGGVLRYRLAFDTQARQIAPEPLPPWQGLPLLCIFSGGSESTRRMVGGVSRLRESAPSRYDALMKGLATLSASGIEAYRKRDIRAFMEVVEAYHKQMDRLGRESGMPIISPVHRDLSRLVGEAGGVYKPSGAGSGDIGIAFTRNMEQRLAVKAAVERAGLSCVDITLAPEEKG